MAHPLFEDGDFPAALTSLYYDGRVDPGIEWKRPPEVCDNPLFINDGASRYDLAQGHLSNCWFLSAAAVLATKRDLFNQVVPCEQSFAEGYTGKFRFRFWRYGFWEEVEVDDRLPYRNGKLYFCYNRETSNEFWSALLEKAYAKVHKSYQALDFGYGHDALVDFTGGIGEFVNLNGALGVKAAENEEDQSRNRTKLFKRLKRLLKKECSLMCSAIDVKTGGVFEDKLDSGLVTGHAYSVVSVLELPLEGGEVCLIKSRNPWGWKEWNGPWSDGSSEWEQVTEAQREELGLAVKDEGEFWMSFSSWVDNFDTLNLCHLTPDAVHGTYGESTWQTGEYHGRWVRGATAGGCSLNPDSYWQNPQYYVKLEDPDEDQDNKCTLVISLLQKYARLRKTLEGQNDTEAAIGFDVFKFRGPEPEELDGFHSTEATLHIQYPMYDFEYFRERTRRLDLSPGTYCIIPSTYAPDTEGHFLLRLAFEKPAQSGEVDTASGHDEAAGSSQTSRFERLFLRHCGQDQAVDARELQSVLNDGIKRPQDEEFSRGTCRALVQAISGERRGTLDRTQCKTVWKTINNYQTSFDEFDQDSSGSLNIRELRKALKATGVTLSKAVLTQLAEQYCARSDQLSLDDFVLIATKVSATSDTFAGLRRRSRAGCSPDDTKVSLSLDEVLKMVL